MACFYNPTHEALVKSWVTCYAGAMFEYMAIIIALNGVCSQHGRLRKRHLSLCRNTAVSFASFRANYPFETWDTAQRKEIITKLTVLRGICPLCAC